jgi:hypothetical protein
LSTAVVLSIFVCKRRPAFALTQVGVACMAAAQVAWWLFVFPVNSRMVNWTPESLPANFEELRDQWEYTYAARDPADLRARGTRPLRSGRDPDRTR